MRNYCELVLYVGRCLSDGLAPGSFYSGSSDPFSLNSISVALRTIERYLLPFQSFGLIIDYNDLVKDNGEADKLMEYAKETLSKCYGDYRATYVHTWENHFCQEDKI